MQPHAAMQARAKLPCAGTGTATGAHSHTILSTYSKPAAIAVTTRMRALQGAGSMESFLQGIHGPRAAAAAGPMAPEWDQLFQQQQQQVGSAE